MSPLPRVDCEKFVRLGLSFLFDRNVMHFRSRASRSGPGEPAHQVSVSRSQESEQYRRCFPTRWQRATARAAHGWGDMHRRLRAGVGRPRSLRHRGVEDRAVKRVEAEYALDGPRGKRCKAEFERDCGTV